MNAIRNALARVMPDPHIIRMSAQENAGVDGWVAWLRERRAVLVREVVSA
jgi:hypothetical protein